MDEHHLGLLCATLLVLILLSGFFSSSETGMMSLNRYRLKHLQKTHRGARLAASMLQRPDRLIGLILIGNNAVNFLAASIATVIATSLWGEAGILVVTVVLTLVFLIFAEVTPKTLAALHPERIAFPAAYVLKPLSVVLAPFVWLVNAVSNALLKVFGVNPEHGEGDPLSHEELRVIVGEARTLIPQRHQSMLLNILDLEEVTVDDIMIPRNEIFGIDLSDDDDEIVARLYSCDYNRVIVYRDEIDEVVGLLHMRTASQFLIDGRLDREAMTRMIRDPYFVPENTPLHSQLLNFQKNKRRMAIVVNEYGVLMGLATLEDILEEIVGEFTSDLADQVLEIRQESGDSFLIEGTATIREINKSLDWDLPLEGPKTLNGLILEHLETIPDANASLRIGKYGFEILALKGNVVERARAHVVNV